MFSLFKDKCKTCGTTRVPPSTVSIIGLEPTRPRDFIGHRFRVAKVIPM